MSRNGSSSVDTFSVPVGVDSLHREEKPRKFSSIQSFIGSLPARLQASNASGSKPTPVSAVKISSSNVALTDKTKPGCAESPAGWKPGPIDPGIVRNPELGDSVPISADVERTIESQVDVGSAGDQYREAVEIPGCSPPTFVYPHSNASIDKDYHDRFQQVVNIFLHNTAEHPRLAENSQFIDYTLKLCGTSFETSRPSILVFCRKQEFRDLRSLLTSSKLRYQYCSSLPARRTIWPRARVSTIEDDNRPLFGLYFWRQQRPRTLLWGQGSIRIIPQPTTPSSSPGYHTNAAREITMLGSMVEILGRERSSTMGCVIKIGSEFYATTSMHTFGTSEPSDESQVAVMASRRSVADRTGGSDRTWLSPLESCPIQRPITQVFDAAIEEDFFLIDSVEYESLSEDEEDHSHTSHNRPGLVSSLHDHQVTIGNNEEMLALFPTVHELQESNDLDLDWAIIKLTHPKNWRPNALFDPNLSSDPIFLSEAAETQPSRETPVLIITARAAPLRGLLQPGEAILGGMNGMVPSKLWTVVLLKQGGLIMGDSGSIVIDATSYVIYGHVIGINPIGDVYISPYSGILEQIRHRFSGSTVTIPEPISTLRHLIDHHNLSTPMDNGSEYLQHLNTAYSVAMAGVDEIEETSPWFRTQKMSPSHPPQALSDDMSCQGSSEDGHPTHPPEGYDHDEMGNSFDNWAASDGDIESAMVSHTQQRTNDSNVPDSLDEFYSQTSPALQKGQATSDHSHRSWKSPERYMGASGDSQGRDPQPMTLRDYVISGSRIYHQNNMTSGDDHLLTMETDHSKSYPAFSLTEPHQAQYHLQTSSEDSKLKSRLTNAPHSSIGPTRRRHAVEAPGRVRKRQSKKPGPSRSSFIASESPDDEYKNCFGHEVPPTLKANCPDEERCIFESHWRHRHLKGQDKWESIQSDFQDRFQKSPGKEMLQLKFKRGRSKYITWIDKDEEMLREAWMRVEKNRYQMMLDTFHAMGGSRNMQLNASDIEVKVVNDLRLEEGLYMNSHGDANIRRRARPRKKRRGHGIDDEDATNIDSRLDNESNHEQEEEVVNQVYGSLTIKKKENDPESHFGLMDMHKWDLQMEMEPGIMPPRDESMEHC